MILETGSRGNKRGKDETPVTVRPFSLTTKCPTFPARFFQPSPRGRLPSERKKQILKTKNDDDSDEPVFRQTEAKLRKAEEVII